MISRQKLLEAAIRVFAESGFRGATTRRIADAAGVNEVTLFRLFKSKSALINEAAQLHAEQRAEYTLPMVPVDPELELTGWCAAQLRYLHGSRALIRKCMAELEEHPQMAECMRPGPLVAKLQLREYTERLCRASGIDPRGDAVPTACTMLMGALFADAMGRDMMPAAYPRPKSRAPALYAQTFLRALGVSASSRRLTNGNGRSIKRRAVRS